MDEIAIGCVAAIFAKEVTLGLRSIRAAQVVGAAAVLLVTVFKAQVSALGLYRCGLDITVLALGVSFLLIAIVQQNNPGKMWTAALRWFGRNSYEVYLTHMFVVFGMLRVFTMTGSRYEWSLIFYVAIVIISGILGALVANHFSEPLNRWLRQREAVAVLPANSISASAGTR